MLTRLWNRFGVRINGRPRRRRSLSRGSGLEHLEPRALLAAQVSLVAPLTPATATSSSGIASRLPGTIQGFQAVQLGSGQIELRWSGGVGANEFVIKQGRTEIARLDSNETNCQVDGLSPGQRYSFSITARNDRGARSDSLGIWIPNEALPTQSDFTISVNSRGQLVLDLESAWTDGQQRLTVRYRLAGSTGYERAATFRSGESSVILDRDVAGQMLELRFSSRPLDNVADGISSETVFVTAPRIDGRS